MRAEIVSVEAQREYLVNVDNLDGYSAYIRKHVPGERWIDRVNQFIASNEINPSDYFTQLTLTGMVAAQYGFVSLEGQHTRHESYGWRRPVASLQHQTAIAMYMARANEDAFRLKDDLLEQYPIAEDLAPGIWGSPFRISGGLVRSWYGENEKITSARLEDRARMRLRVGKIPISLPDRELNSRLTAFGFTNAEADRMPPNEFLRDIFPAIRVLVNDVTRPRRVFTAR